MDVMRSLPHAHNRSSVLHVISHDHHLIILNNRMLLKQVDELREEASALKMEKARLSAKVGESCSPCIH